MTAIESFTLTWPEVHQYASTLAAKLGVDLADRLPIPGTLAWLALDDESAVKKAALLQIASQRILHLEVEQEARAAASKAVAAAADWPQVGRELQQLDAARRSGARIERSANYEFGDRAVKR